MLPLRKQRLARTVALFVPLLLGTATAVWAQDAGHEAAAVAEDGSTLSLIASAFVFMLATFIGLDVIRNVSRLLHTPLMSLTNAISAIAVVGAILVAGPEMTADHPTYINVLGLVAIVCSVTNIVSGFLITDRMLKMFKTREAGK